MIKEAQAQVQIQVQASAQAQQSGPTKHHWMSLFVITFEYFFSRT